MDDAVVEILLNVKEQGQAAFAEAQAGLDMVRRAVEKFAQAQTDGMTATFAMREALKSFRDMSLEAGLTTEEQRIAINQARDAMLTYNASVTGGLPEMAALSAALSAVSGEFVANAAAADADAAATSKVAASQAGLIDLVKSGLTGLPGFLGGAVTTLALPALIATAAAALFPFVAVVTAAVVVMTAFGVAATGMALALAGAAGMFLTIGGAIVLLDDKMGWINNSMGTLKTHLRDVGGELAKLAAPAANQIVQFIDSLLPLAQSFGAGIIEWFSTRLPLALTSMHSAINNLAPDLRGFGTFLGDMFDKLSPQIVPMFEEIAQFGIGALKGLISNLVDLGQWFQQRLPSYLPVVSSMFGGLGTGIQFAVTQFGKLSDWFVGQWPNIKKNVDAFTSGFSDAFDKLNKTFGGPGSVDWKGFFHTLGEAVGGAVAAISDMGRIVGIVFAQVVASLPAALQIIANNWTNFVRAVIIDINNLITAHNSLPWFLGGGAKLSLIPLPNAPSNSSGPSNNAQTPPTSSQQVTKVVVGLDQGLILKNISTVNRRLLST